MKEKYKQYIEIDKEHMKKTIELSKLKLTKRKMKYEENKMNIWLSFFKMESMKYCLMSLIITLILCVISVVMPMSGYGICLVNAAVLGTIILYDFIRSSLVGMEELLRTVRYNPSKIFAYKSNIYLLMSIMSILTLNLVLCTQGAFSFMTTLLFSLIPLYFISGIALMIVDHISNKMTLIILYAGSYYLSGAILSMQNYNAISNQTILFLLVVSFCCYCVGIYVHFVYMHNEKGDYLWKSTLKD